MIRTSRTSINEWNQWNLTDSEAVRPSHQPAGAKGVRVFRPTHPLSPPQCPAAGLLPPQVPSRHQMDRHLFVMCLTSQYLPGDVWCHAVSPCVYLNIKIPGSNVTPFGVSWFFLRRLLWRVPAHAVFFHFHLLAWTSLEAHNPEMSGSLRFSWAHKIQKPQKIQKPKK